MNAFVRQIAVLCVLWAMCELLLPDGKQQQMVRMTASLLVMAALLSTIGGWIGGEQPVQAAITYRMQRASEDVYQRTALAAMANQLESYCVHMAERAGYRCRAVVAMAMDGTVQLIELDMQASASVLMDAEELSAMLASQLQVDESRIRLLSEDL